MFKKIFFLMFENKGHPNNKFGFLWQLFSLYSKSVNNSFSLILVCAVTIMQVLSTTLHASSLKIVLLALICNYWLDTFSTVTRFLVVF